MIEIVGAPFDLCGMRLGSRLGPAALRLAGLVPTLEGLGLSVSDLGDLPMRTEPDSTEGLRHFEPLLDAVKILRHAVASSLASGRIPIVLGGEHTLAVSGVAAALEAFGPNLGVLWIDAHADINTPGTSETGNIHGMPIAALAELPSGVDDARDVQWNRLLEALRPSPGLRLDHTMWYALRDVDPAERPRLEGLAITMHDIDRHGVEATVRRMDDWMRAKGIDALWISFDVDSLDPILAPGTGTAVRGGLTYREAHLCAELLHEHLGAADCPYRLVGVDLVETNPIYDTMNSTATMAVEWIASLFGKRILGPDLRR